MSTRPLSAGAVAALGAGQCVCWGVSYYAVGVFGDAMARDLALPTPIIHGGLTAALLTMAASSAAVGRAVDRWGGRVVMSAGAVLMATALLALAAAQGLFSFYAAWILLGLAMRLTLYDACFAALIRAYGADSRRPIAWIAACGGLASSLFWPLGQALTDAWDWRSATTLYALLALATLPIQRLIPPGRAAPAPVRPLASIAGRHPPAGPALFGVTVAAAAALNAGLSAHLIGALGAFGVVGAAAAQLAALRGLGQTAARLAEGRWGARLSPTGLGVLAAALCVAGLALALTGTTGAIAAATGCVLLLGAGIGLATVARATTPLALFDPADYGRKVGTVIGPSFLAAAAAPPAFALCVDRLGPVGALGAAGALALIGLSAAEALRRLSTD